MRDLGSPWKGGGGGHDKGQLSAPLTSLDAELYDTFPSALIRIFILALIRLRAKLSRLIPDLALSNTESVNISWAAPRRPGSR